MRDPSHPRLTRENGFRKVSDTVAVWTDGAHARYDDATLPRVPHIAILRPNLKVCVIKMSLYNQWFLNSIRRQLGL
jgi:hypothetical protein